MAEPVPAPDCPYCGNPATLWRWGEHEHYPYGRNLGRVWGCHPCQAWVGCHPQSSRTHPANTPLGRLAKAELRKLKQETHKAFDRLWQRKRHREGGTLGRARREGYAWLAAQLAIPVEDCHIGKFDEETCRRAIAICKPFHAENRGLMPARLYDELVSAGVTLHTPESATAIEGDRHGELRKAEDEKGGADPTGAEDAQVDGIVGPETARP